jgi:uncharacterized membrane protein
MIRSFVSNKLLHKGEAIMGKDIREGIFDLIQSQHAGFNHDSCISVDELNQYRRLYLTSLIAREKGEIALIDDDVLTAIKNNSILTEDLQNKINEQRPTFGQRMADMIAVFGGSWMFVIAFFSFILLWILINVWQWSVKPYDPFPFILLNLILSCLAAVQAPIIMMSQNRQEQKDRKNVDNDHKINLKAELEIKLLSEKIDHLLVQQNKKLLEIQEVQTDYLEDLVKALNIQGKTRNEKIA